MSASLGPKLFTLSRDELKGMMQANHDSLAKCVADLTAAIEVEGNEIVKESLAAWLKRLARDFDETRFMLEHLSDTKVHHLTGTELIGIGRTFREVTINIPQIRLSPPPSSGEMAERKQAATIAAVPRASVPDFLVGARG